MTHKPIPPTANVVEVKEGAKLFAPSALRNVDALTTLVTTYAPHPGRALEIASGTGQHMVHYASALPNLRWYPTDVEGPRLRSIDAHVAETQLANVAPAQFLDATARGWHTTFGRNDLILCSNLLHLITPLQTETLISEAAFALGVSGTLILYGPFSRAGHLTSDGDRRFDAELRAADPAIGYKDTRDMALWLRDAGLNVETVEMPANNLAYIARKSAL
ncbi:MAG: DUF938 domain-containing protein [Sulfitobacter sp.]